jgi:polysaccharide chain length determinant protein (PEP-CTERM system associated)
MEQELDLRSYFAVLRRRYLYLVVPAILICASVAVIAYLLPKLYQASATILVETQQIPIDLAAPTVTANAAERIHVIQQRLLARDNLLQIANKFSLYDYEGESRSPTSIVENMRDAIDIEQIDVSSRTSRRDGSVIGFTVSFEYRNPTTASRVTNELVQSILSQNVESRLSRATETSGFFKSQLDDLRQRLHVAEQKIADFKRDNNAALPETLPDRRQQLDQINAKIGELNQRIQLAGSSDPALASTDGGDLQSLTYSLQAQKINLDAYQKKRLAVGPLVQKGYFPKNQLAELDRQIGVTKVQIASLEAQIASKGGATLNGDVVAALKSQRDELKQQAAALNVNILKTPTVQAELSNLERDRQSLQSEYQQSQAKLEDAMTGERLEQDRQAERFEVIEQASIPTRPTKPNRPRIIMAGSFGGFAFGAGLVVLLEMLDNSIRTAADLEKHVQLKPIAEIPYISTIAERRRGRWRFALAIVAIVGVIVGMLVAVHFYYMPLDVLADRIWQQINIWLPISSLIAH